MQTNITIPQHSADQQVVDIRMYFDSPADMNACIVDGTESVRVGFSILPIWNQMTIQQKTLIRQWYKRLAVLALNQHFENKLYGVTITENEIEGEILSE